MSPTIWEIRVIDSGADIDSKNQYKCTSLHYAAKSDNKDVVELLIAHGADIHAIDKSKLTPFLLAVKYGHRDIVELLLSKEVEVNDIASQAYIRTALYLAINRDYSDVFNVLVTHVVDVNKKIDQNDNTLLHYAVSCGQKDMVELLLAKEADVNAKNRLGMTPLHEAARHRYTELFDLLVSNGADPNITDEHNKTPHDYVIEAQQRDYITISPGGTGPYSIIVTDLVEIRQFLPFETMDFDDVWIPEPQNLDGLESSLRNYLYAQISASPDIHTKNEYKYILTNIQQYNLEYTGFTKDGTKYIFCNMTMFNLSFNNKPSGNSFTMFLDGGTNFIRVIYECKSKKVIMIEWNGDA